MMEKRRQDKDIVIEISWCYRNKSDEYEYQEGRNVDFQMLWKGAQIMMRLQREIKLKDSEILWVTNRGTPLSPSNFFRSLVT